MAYGTDRTESPAANHRVSVDEFKPREDDADGDDHHAAEADCHVAFEKFDVRSELSAQRREIGLSGKLRDSFGDRLGPPGCHGAKPAASSRRASFRVSNGVAISVTRSVTRLERATHFPSPLTPARH